MQLAGYTIIFDLDGTLVETAPDLHRALNAVMDRESLAHVSYDKVKAYVGQGAKKLIERGGQTAGREFSEDELNELTKLFIKVYEDDIAAHSFIFPGVEKALDNLESEGAQFCVCTNKYTHLAEKLLETLNLAHRFKAIIGADSVPAKKPDAAHLEYSVAKAGGNMRKAIMIGDSASDVGAARNAGIPVIIASFGYTDTSPEALKADRIFDHFDELQAKILSLTAITP